MDAGARAAAWQLGGRHLKEGFMNSYYIDPHQNPYWQNLNGNSNGAAGAQQQKDPNWHPEPEYGRQLGRTAAVLAMLSLLSTVFLPVILPFIFASIAIVLAIISKGRQKSFSSGARRAFTVGIVSLVLNAAVCATAVYGFHMILHDADARAEANRLMESMYGYSFDDLMEQVMDEYGIDVQSGTMLIPDTQGGDVA